MPRRQHLAMQINHESFVLWIERDDERPGGLTGLVERTRTSERIAFQSREELLRFLERDAPAGRAPAPIADPAGEMGGT